MKNTGKKSSHQRQKLFPPRLAKQVPPTELSRECWFRSALRFLGRDMGPGVEDLVAYARLISDEGEMLVVGYDGQNEAFFAVPYDENTGRSFIVSFSSRESFEFYCRRRLLVFWLDETFEPTTIADYDRAWRARRETLRTQEHEFRRFAE